jgi:hypothetical protein
MMKTTCLPFENKRKKIARIVYKIPNSAPACGMK